MSLSLFSCSNKIKLEDFMRKTKKKQNAETRESTILKRGKMGGFDSRGVINLDMPECLADIVAEKKECCCGSFIQKEECFSCAYQNPTIKHI